MARLTSLGRKRRQRRQALLIGGLKLVGYGGLLVLVSMSGYHVGISQNATEIARLRQDLEERRRANEALVERVATAEEEARRAEAQLERFERAYRANVPRGEVKELLERIEAKLAQGVPAERLGFVIGEAGGERSCDSGVETRRLEARTPITTQVDNSVTFADNRITVSGEGEPARDEDGVAETWFDPDAPVTLRFLTINGDISSVEGRLPMTHSIVLEGDEYRFSANRGEARGTIAVTAQRCDFP